MHTGVWGSCVRIVKFYRALRLPVLGHMGIVKQNPTTPINFGSAAPFSPPLVPFLLIPSFTTTYNIDKRIHTPLTASGSLYLFNLVRGKSHFEAATESRQRRDTRPNSFQLLSQLLPNPILQLGPSLTLTEPLCRRDLAVRHVPAVGFRSDAGAVHECTRTNLGRATQNLLGEADGAGVVFARELAVAEARSSEEGLAIDWAATYYVLGRLTQEPHSLR
jgi:hypothetical protein